MICPHCHFSVPDGSPLCPYCGADLDRLAAPRRSAGERVSQFLKAKEFRLPRIAGLLALVLLLQLVTISLLPRQQAKLQRQVEEKTAAVAELGGQITQTQKSVESMLWDADNAEYITEFYDTYVVFVVEGDPNYHHFPCPDYHLPFEYRAMGKNLAEAWPYHPCPSCCSQE